MVKSGIKFKVGDKVVSKEDGAGGTIARICSDDTAVFVRWDESPTQQRMVEVASLNPIGGEG